MRWNISKPFVDCFVGEVSFIIPYQTSNFAEKFPNFFQLICILYITTSKIRYTLSLFILKEWILSFFHVTEGFNWGGLPKTKTLVLKVEREELFKSDFLRWNWTGNFRNIKIISPEVKCFHKCFHKCIESLSFTFKKWSQYLVFLQFCRISMQCQCVGFLSHWLTIYTISSPS